MPFSPHNPNLRRRVLPGLLTVAASAFLRPLLIPFRRKGPAREELTVFASYMVGDLYMALPALKKIAAARPVRVLCRPDCVGLLAAEGVPAAGFANPFREKGLPGFAATWKAARALRGRAGDALDLDADPRTAFWMRIAGLRAVSYRRAFGALFDETFDLGEPSVHQADRDLRVVEAYLRLNPRARAEGAGGFEESPASGAGESSPPALHPAPPGAPWLLSVWTRKPAKNWALENWDAFLGRALAAGVPVRVLEPPDGDAAFAAFRARWEARVPFFKGNLDAVARAVRDAAGVAATDNFLGHMGGYYGKPVLWINRVSPTLQVIPRGPRTVEARSEQPARADRPDVETAWRAFEGLLANPG
jgi:ADP-heptose:LPS heptosyltransferase